ncbi:YncE family protein [Aquimarina sp. M1]
MYNTRTLDYIKHEVVGGDAHLSPVGIALSVAAQNENKITVFNRFNLTKLDEIPFSSSHGIINNRRLVFTTAIADNLVGVIDRFSNRVVSEIDTEFNTPHNLTVNRRGNLLFLSHSGSTATKVVFYQVGRNAQLEQLSEFDSGLNPFGVLRY